MRGLLFYTFVLVPGHLQGATAAAGLDQTWEEMGRHQLYIHTPV